MSAPPTLAAASRWQRFRQSPSAQLLMAWVVVGLPFVAANAVTRLWMDTPDLRALRNPLKTLVLLAAYWAFVRFIERRAVMALSPRHAGRELCAGFGWGLGLISATVALLSLLGFYRVGGWGSPAGMLQMLYLHLFVAVLEEVLFRGLLLHLLEKIIGTWPALAVSTALFGVAHLANPDANALTLSCLGLLAVCLSLAFLATRRLWLCIGLHWAWNFAQGGIFSLPVSGTQLWPGLLDARSAGPAWATGGEFGIEASAVTLVLTLLLSVRFFTQAQQRSAANPRGHDVHLG